MLGDEAGADTETCVMGDVGTLEYEDKRSIAPSRFARRETKAVGAH